MLSKTPRFPFDKKLENTTRSRVAGASFEPGPGDYSDYLQSPRVPAATISSKCSKPQPTGRLRKLYVCPVPYSLEARGPSIPTKLDENGYEIDENNKLKKLPPYICDTSLGPAYYCVRLVSVLIVFTFLGA